ncbi:oxidoreductase [Fusarium mundagurra]|uniref:Oxidoreductase n=1 Tax=Fusarium mundagurra TaxID=1567541 RepID=A0A8H5YIX0_9HYPO|nr:oxidoreductase [Fusarium mundagurra]
MVSLRDIGLLLLAAPAIAAPKAPAEITVKTLPFSPSADTSKAPSSSASTSPTSDAAQRAGCQLPLRFTTFALYSDTGCQNAIYDPFTLTWDPCKGYQWTNALANVLSIFPRYFSNLHSMSYTLEPNVAAVLPVKQGQLTIQQRPVPNPKEGELLVRNAAVAANPSDWKIQGFGLSTNFPAVLGSDLSGVIVSVGPGVTRFKPGDRVIGFALGVISENIDKAAFQTYTLLDEVATTHLPDNISLEEGSVLPVGVLTAAIALFDGLGLPMREKTAEEYGAILVWSGASAVGISAVQIAHALGWTAYTTASLKHHEWLKTLGATDTWDYRDPEVAQKIAQALRSSGKKIRGVIDARAEGSSFESVAKILTAADIKPECKATALFPWPEETSLPAGIEGHHTNCVGFTVNYPDIASWIFGGWLSKALEDGRIKPAPRARVIEGGLEATQEMLNLLKAGASGEKFVLKV